MLYRKIGLFFAALGLIFSVATTAVAQEGEGQEEEAATAPEGLQEYQVDPTHSSLVFRIKHTDMGYVFGMFRGVAGSLTFDPENLEESSLEFTAEAKSIFTNNETRDEHLRSPDFFAAEEHPEITFESTSIEEVGEKQYRITGDLTVRGTTQEVELSASQTGQGLDSAGQFRRGFITAFEIDRMDFGVDEMPDGLSHEVRIIFSTQAFIPEE